MNFKNNKESKNKIQNNAEAIKNFEELINNIQILRNKNHGCPWQNAQTHESLVPYLLEESYEFINSIEQNDSENMKEELGDILLQVMLHAEIKKENKYFGINDIIHQLNNKIKSRHPYVFTKRKKISIKEAKKVWQDIKAKEKLNQKKLNPSNLSSKLKNQTVLQETEKIHFYVEELGFRWNTNIEIIEKLYEEINELKEAIKNKNKENIEEEIGDIFFTLTSLSAFLKINPDKALRAANKKFINRFKIIEKILGDTITKQPINKFKELWKITKEKLKKTM